MKRKILSLTVAVMLVITLLPIMAQAAEVTATISSHVTGSLDAEIEAYKLDNGITVDDVITGLIVSGGTINHVDRNFLYDNNLHKTLKTVDFSGTSIDYRGLTGYPATNPNELPGYAFGQWSALTSVVLPDDLTVIKDRAFNNCTSLESLTLPHGFTEIGASAFYSCSKLKDLYTSSPIPPPIPSASYYPFSSDVAYGAAIHVPAGSETAWDQGDSDSHHDADRKWCGLFIEDMVPLITGSWSTRTSEITAEIHVISDEPGSCYYAAVKDGGPEPVIDTLGVGVASDSNYSGTYTAQLSITGLETGAYDIYVKIKDLRGNVSELVRINLEDYVFPVDVIINNHETGKLDDEIAAVLSSFGIPGRNEKIRSLKVAGGSLDSTDWDVFSYRYEMEYAIQSIDLAGTSSLSVPDSALDCYSMAVISLPAGIESIGECAFEDCASLTDITIPSSAPPTVGADAFLGIPLTAVIHVPAGSAAAYKDVADGDTTDNLWYGLTVLEIVPSTYTVIFNSNGSVYATKTVNAGESIGSTEWPSNPTRAGYTLGSWYTGQNGSGSVFTSATAVNANMTAYAKWTYSGGGGGSGSTPSTPTIPTYKADVKTGNGSDTTISVTVNKDTGIASIDTSSQSLNQGRTVITIPSIPDVDTYSVGIPVAELSTLDAQGTLTVNTDTGSITVPSNMLTGASGIRGSKAEISIGQGDKDNLPDDVKATIGDKPLISLSLSIDGRQTDWSNPDAPATVNIPYTPTAAELANPESIVVWYIDGSGNVVTVPNGHYDTATGMVTFEATHFSDYAVAYNAVSFNDVAVGAWYSKAVSFIAARGITSGTGNGNYSPDAKLTRGEFIVLMMRAYGIAPDTNPTDNFSDAGSTYYTDYLAAAKRLGISAGIGNNMYAPGKEITRQEMFTQLYNALKVINQLPQGNSGKTLYDFSDAGQINSWAKDTITLLVETETIGGNNGKLSPTGTTTRAEMAQVLYNLLSK